MIFNDVIAPLTVAATTAALGPNSATQAKVTTSPSTILAFTPGMLIGPQRRYQ